MLNLPPTRRLRERRQEQGRVAPGPLLVQPAGHRAEEPPLFVDECHSPGWGGGDAPEGRSVVRLGRHDEQAVPLLGRAGVDVDPAVGRGRPPTKDGEDWGASVSRPGGRRAPALPSLPCSGRPSAPRQSSLRYDRRVRGPRTLPGRRPRMTRRLPRRLGVHGTRLGLVRAHVLLRLVGRLRVLTRTSAGRCRRPCCPVGRLDQNRLPTELLRRLAMSWATRWSRRRWLCYRFSFGVTSTASCPGRPAWLPPTG